MRPTTTPCFAPDGSGGGLPPQDPNRFAIGGWLLNQDMYYTLFNGGHTYTVAQLGEIWGHICPFALGP